MPRCRAQRHVPEGLLMKDDIRPVSPVALSSLGNHDRCACFPELCGCCAVYRVRVKPACSTSARTVYPAAFAQCLPLGHILVIPSLFQTFHSCVFEVMGSVTSDQDLVNLGGWPAGFS